MPKSIPSHEEVFAEIRALDPETLEAFQQVAQEKGTTVYRLMLAFLVFERRREKRAQRPSSL
jgi:hypothetical protein